MPHRAYIKHFAYEISRKVLNSYTEKYAFHEVLKIWRLMISRPTNVESNFVILLFT